MVEEMYNWEKNIVKENYEYYINNILNNYFIIPLINGENIIIKNEETDFPHLIGKDHFTKINLRNKNAKQICKMINNSRSFGLQDLIDEKALNGGKMNQDETFVYDKNYYFIDAFSKFDEISKNEQQDLKIYIYKYRDQNINNIKNNRRNRNNFDTDYLFLAIEDKNELVEIGIKGMDNKHIYKFNSVVVPRRKDQYNGYPLRTKNKIKIVEITTDISQIKKHPSKRAIIKGVKLD